MLTDALFYSGASIIMRQNEPFTDNITIAGLSGRTVGSGVGYSLVPDLKKVPGVKVRVRATARSRSHATSTFIDGDTSSKIVSASSRRFDVSPRAMKKPIATSPL